jgi:hypothetical protein
MRGMVCMPTASQADIRRGSGLQRLLLVATRRDHGQAAGGYVSFPTVSKILDLTVMLAEAIKTILLLQ